MKISYLLTSPRIIKHKNPRFAKIPPRNDPKCIQTSIQASVPQNFNQVPQNGANFSPPLVRGDLSCKNEFIQSYLNEKSWLDYPTVVSFHSFEPKCQFSH
jgi:hypothetical protein